MEDLNGEDNVEWGLLPPGVPVAVQTPLDVVEALECDLLELPGSKRHIFGGGGMRHKKGQGFRIPQVGL